MPFSTFRNAPGPAAGRLRKRRAILVDALRGDHADPWSAVDAICHRLAASGRTFSDSADLLREDRDR